MALKKDPLKNSLLCVILDKDIMRSGVLIDTAVKTLRSGADMIQLRGKRTSVCELIRDAVSLKKLTLKYGVPLVVNDRIDVAVASGADGLHLGQSDISIKTARYILGPDKIIGLSAVNMKQAIRAEKLGADYLGIGPVFKTPLKSQKEACGTGLLSKIGRLKVPSIAIGGINMQNVKELVLVGSKRIAVIRAVCSSDDPGAATRRLKEAIA